MSSTLEDLDFSIEDESNSTKLRIAEKAFQITLDVLVHGPGNRDYYDQDGNRRGFERTRWNNEINTTIDDDRFKGSFTRRNILDRAIITTLVGTGNCDQHAFVAFCYLLMKGVPDVYISQEETHTFVTIGEIKKGRTIIVCDPWDNNCFEGTITHLRTLANRQKSVTVVGLDGIKTYKFKTTGVNNVGVNFALNLDQWKSRYQELFAEFQSSDPCELVNEINQYKAQINNAILSSQPYQANNIGAVSRYGLRRQYSEISNAILGIFEEEDQKSAADKLSLFDS